MSDNIFKSSFVSIAEMKKVIPVIDENHKRIIGINEEKSSDKLNFDFSEATEEKSDEQDQVKEINLASFDVDFPENLLETEAKNDLETETMSEDDIAYARIKADEASDGSLDFNGLDMRSKQTDFSDVDELSLDSESLPSMTLKLAKEEAELLINDAKRVAFEIEREANEKGYKEGLKLGEEKYREEIEAERASLKEKELAMESEVEAKLRSYEPQIASIISSLVTQLVGNSEDENIILFLVRLALAENTSKGKVAINVCDEDFEKVSQHFEDSEYKDDKIGIEIKKNESLSKNDCLLETEFGVLDSSLSVRLDSFLKEINVIKESLKSVDNV